MTMTEQRANVSSLQNMLALLNATMLLVHQIDAAFWHEWDMFRLPGGTQLNLLLNMPIVALVTYSYGAARRNELASRFWIMFTATLGSVTLAIHAGFFVAGYREFGQPVSVMVFCGIAAVSSIQVWALRRLTTKRR